MEDEQPSSSPSALQRVVELANEGSRFCQYPMLVSTMKSESISLKDSQPT
jgi:hypothetical protein